MDSKDLLHGRRLCRRTHHGCHCQDVPQGATILLCSKSLSTGCCVTWRSLAIAYSWYKSYRIQTAIFFCNPVGRKDVHRGHDEERERESSKVWEFVHHVSLVSLSLVLSQSLILDFSQQLLNTYLACLTCRASSLSFLSDSCLRYGSFSDAD